MSVVGPIAAKKLQGRKCSEVFSLQQNSLASHSRNGEVSATPRAWLRSGTERRGRCRNLCCTKPRAASPAYGYLINLAAAALRASKERTDRVSLGTAANRAICSCVSCSSVILLERSRRTEQRGRSMVVAMAVGLALSGLKEEARAVLATSRRACGRDRAERVGHRKFRCRSCDRRSRGMAAVGGRRRSSCCHRCWRWFAATAH